MVTHRRVLDRAFGAALLRRKRLCPILGGTSLASSFPLSSQSLRLNCSRAMASGPNEPWTYFAIHRDWCDHLLFQSDETFTRGTRRGSGTWRLAQPSGNGIVLELDWLDGSGQVLASEDGSTEHFGAGRIELRRVGAAALPLGGLRPRPRRGLLFSSVGSQCLPVVRDSWLVKPDEAQFDVALVHYKEPGSKVYRGLQELARSHDFVELHQNQDMKWPNFRHWLELKGGAAAVVAQYDYIWVVDDDVRMPTGEINKFFALLRQHEEVSIACPSFDAQSDGVWRYFDGHDPRFNIRYTDFVECTAPAVKASILLDPLFMRCLQTVQTGCFLDFCFHPVSGGGLQSVAIVDAVKCHHPPRGADAPSEMREVMPWEDHKQDMKLFQQAGLPKDWWWWRKPCVFGGIPSAGE